MMSVVVSSANRGQQCAEGVAGLREGKGGGEGDWGASEGKTQLTQLLVLWLWAKQVHNPEMPPKLSKFPGGHLRPLQQGRVHAPSTPLATQHAGRNSTMTSTAVQPS